MATILEYTHNATSTKNSDHTNKAGISQNHTVDTKVGKLLLFCGKLYHRYILINNFMFALGYIRVAILENVRFSSWAAH